MCVARKLNQPPTERVFYKEEVAVQQPRSLGPVHLLLTSAMKLTDAELTDSVSLGLDILILEKKIFCLYQT